jgi:hypothetical protein
MLNKESLIIKLLANDLEFEIKFSKFLISLCLYLLKLALDKIEPSIREA